MRYLRNTGKLSEAVAAPGGQKAFDRYLISGVLIALFWLLVMPSPSQAKLIGLESSPGSPDINTNGTEIVYDYFGTGGQLKIQSYASDTLVSQEIVIPANNPFWGTGASQEVWKLRDPQQAGTGPFDNAFKRTGYELIANFDAAGDFLNGTVTVTGAIDTFTTGILDPGSMDYATILDPDLAGPCFQLCSGYNGGTYDGAATFLVGDLTGFGFKGVVTTVEDNAAAGGDNDGICEGGETCNSVDSLQIDWFLEVTGGDLFTAGFQGGGQQFDMGVIASGLVSYGDGVAASSFGSYGSFWDPNDNGSPWVPGYVPDTTAFLEDFRSCDPLNGGRCEVLLDTFVPVPAAVWLFGSGLIGLFGFGARNRARNRSAA